MKNIIILVDVQNGFVKTSYAEETFVRIRELMDKRLFDVVIATKYWNDPTSPLYNLMDWHYMCTEEEQAIKAEIADCVDYVTRKDTYSAMTDEMVKLLKMLNGGSLPEYVFVLGFDTECCVLTTATDLFELGVRPILLADYSGSHDGPHYHEAGLLSLDHLIGPKFIIRDIEIKTKEDIDSIVASIMK